MQSATISFLLDLNRQFYQTFGRAFAATRRRIQPGVRRVLAELGSLGPGDYLDLGCGSGSLAAAWMESGPPGSYTGLDFSPELLDEARLAVAGLERDDLRLRFLPADLSDPGWAAPLAEERFDAVLAFAALHHIPSHELRVSILHQVRELLKPGGAFIHSEWQFQNNPRLLERILPWERVGLDDANLEPGDTLLDWRYTLPEQPEQVGLRYVHLFDRAELIMLAHETGFEVVEEFELDGQGGRMGLYQRWQ